MPFEGERGGSHEEGNEGADTHLEGRRKVAIRGKGGGGGRQAGNHDGRIMKLPPLFLILKISI